MGAALVTSQQSVAVAEKYVPYNKGFYKLPYKTGAGSSKSFASIHTAV